MIRRLALGLALLAPLGANAQNAVTQNGTVVPGDVMQWARDRTAQDPGGLTGRTATGIGLNPFSITDNNGLGLCSNTAATVGPYNALCFGHGSDGKGLITLDSFGGTPATGLDFRFNGVTYGFPGPGNGNVLGPTPSPTANNIAIWNGGLTQRVGGPAVLNDGRTIIPDATQGGQNVVISSDGTAADGLVGAGVFYDALSGVAHAKPTVNPILQVNGVAGYVLNENATPGGLGQKGNAVGVYGHVNNKATGAWGWGINTQVVGFAGFTSHLYNEFDLSPANAGDVVVGLQISGAAKVQPASSVAFLVGTLDLQNLGTPAPYRWDAGFITQPGAASIGMQLGPTTRAAVAATASPSQPIVFQSFTTTGAISNYAISGSGASLDLYNLSGDATPIFRVNADLALQGVHLMQINNQTVLSNAANTTQLGIGAGITKVTIGNASAPTVILSLPVNCTGQTAGTLWKNAGVVNVCP